MQLVVRGHEEIHVLFLSKENRISKTHFEQICIGIGVYCPQKQRAGDMYGTAKEYYTSGKTG